MIRVTVWNEYIQEQLDYNRFDLESKWHCTEEDWQHIAEKARSIRQVHPHGIHETLKNLLEADPEIRVCHIGTLEMENCGLTEEILNDTDVLVWWSHIAQQDVPDSVAQMVADHVRRGMGLMVLHSGHMCKPMQLLLGTSCTLRWREGDRENLWCIAPTHPIAAGVAEQICLDEEEMYGEFFDIPTPDELVFLGAFGGGEVFRSGCVWNRGYGKFFYFQPGHETNPSYHNPEIQKILRNAVHYLCPTRPRLPSLECRAV